MPQRRLTRCRCQIGTAFSAFDRYCAGGLRLTLRESFQPHVADQGALVPLWIYELPNWTLGALTAVIWLLLGSLVHAACGLFMHKPLREDDRNLAIALLAVVATVNSLLLAFSAVSVWEAYSTAEKAVNAEATTIGELGRDLALFGSVESRRARELLKAYAGDVVQNEWAAMQHQQSSEATGNLFDAMFRAVGDTHPATPHEMTLMPEIWARTNELVKFRRDRLAAGEGKVPETLWSVVILGSLLTLVPVCVLPRTTFNRVSIGILSLSVGLVFFFIAAMDRPFVGKESVAAEPIESSLRGLERWDGQTAALAANGAASR
jgi:hypothetical protein